MGPTSQDGAHSETAARRPAAGRAAHYAPPPMRVLVVTNLWPTAERPASGGFVRDQVEALRALDGVDLELFTFGRGSRAYGAAARELRRRYKGERFDVIHAHYGLAGWSSLAKRGAPHVV